MALSIYVLKYERTSYTYGFIYFTYHQLNEEERHLGLGATDLVEPEWRPELDSLIEIVNGCAGADPNDLDDGCETAVHLLYGALWMLDQQESIIDCELALSLLDLLESEFTVSRGTHTRRAFSGVYATGRSEPLGSVVTRVLERKCGKTATSPAELRSWIIAECR